MEWLDTIAKVVPVFGAVGAVSLGLLVWEKIEHAKTKAELKRCYESRVSEAMALTAVVSGSNAASAARDLSQGELSRSFQTLTATLQIVQVGARVR